MFPTGKKRTHWTQKKPPKRLKLKLPPVPKKYRNLKWKEPMDRPFFTVIYESTKIPPCKWMVTVIPEDETSAEVAGPFPDLDRAIEAKKLIAQELKRRKPLTGKRHRG